MESKYSLNWVLFLVTRPKTRSQSALLWKMVGVPFITLARFLKHFSLVIGDCMDPMVSHASCGCWLNSGRGVILVSLELVFKLVPFCSIWQTWVPIQKVGQLGECGLGTGFGVSYCSADKRFVSKWKFLQHVLHSSGEELPDISMELLWWHLTTKGLELGPGVTADNQLRAVQLMLAIWVSAANMLRAFLQVCHEGER